MWGPAGQTESEDREATKEELEERLAKHDWDAMREFISLHRIGDNLRYESEHNHNKGWARYVIRRGSLTITLVLYVRMS